VWGKPGTPADVELTTAPQVTATRHRRAVFHRRINFVIKNTGHRRCNTNTLLIYSTVSGSKQIVVKRELIFIMRLMLQIIDIVVRHSDAFSVRDGFVATTVAFTNRRHKHAP